MLIIALGCVITYGLGYTIIFFFFVDILKFSGNAPTWLYLTALGAAVSVPIAWCLIYTRYRLAPKTPHAKLRLQRLRKLSENETTRHRLPHRLVEYRLLRSGRNVTESCKKLFIHANMTVAVVADRLDASFHSMSPSPWFEPIDIQDEDAHEELYAAFEYGSTATATENYDEASSQIVMPVAVPAQGGDLDLDRYLYLLLGFNCNTNPSWTWD